MLTSDVHGEKKKEKRKMNKKAMHKARSNVVPSVFCAKGRLLLFTLL